MSYSGLLTVIALAILLAAPAFSQSPESPAASIRPVTITTAGGRTFIVGVQRRILEPVETPAETPRKPLSKERKASP